VGLGGEGYYLKGTHLKCTNFYIPPHPNPTNLQKKWRRFNDKTRGLKKPNNFDFLGENSIKSTPILSYHYIKANQK
jgi:hypothetical protein